MLAFCRELCEVCPTHLSLCASCRVLMFPLARLKKDFYRFTKVQDKVWFWML